MLFAWRDGQAELTWAAVYIPICPSANGRNVYSTTPCPEKNIPDIFDCNFKKDY